MVNLLQIHDPSRNGDVLANQNDPALKGVELKSRGDGTFEVSSDPQGNAKKLIESLSIVVGNAASEVIKQ